MEDEEELAVWLTCALAQSGFVTERAVDGVIAEAPLDSGEFDAAVLSLRLPRGDDFAVLAGMRARDNRTSVLILTVQGALDERVCGLNAGADGFLVKPSALSGLKAYSMALIRRNHGRAFPCLCYGPPGFDTECKAFLLPGEPLVLTSRECTALSALLHRTGQSISRMCLFDEISNLGNDSSPDTVEVIVHHLRKKLVDVGVQIVIAWGLSYLLEAGDGEAPVAGSSNA